MPHRKPNNNKGLKKFRKMGCKRNKVPSSKVNVMCTTLVATFVICWLPKHVWHLARLRGIAISEEKVVTSIEFSFS